MARQRVNTRQPRAQKRLTQWIGVQLGPSTIGGNQSTLLASLDAAGLVLAPFTVVRSRFILTVWSDQVAASEIVEGVFGVIVVKNTAVLIGATAVPDPFVEFADDWYVYNPFQQQATRAVENASGTFTEVSQTQMVIDSKAMRKVDTGEDLAFMVRNSSATAGLVITVTGRFLVKLH